MKAKVKRGAGFRGLLNYLLAIRKAAEIIGGNMVANQARELSTEFGYVRHLRPDIKRPVLHFALRMPDGEDVSPELWNKIALRFMEEMELSLNRPWLVVKHLDQHIHIATSRIDYDANVWLGKWEALRAIKATHKLEIEFKLRLTPTLKFLNPNDSALIVADDKIRLTSGQIAKGKREQAEGKPLETPVKVQIADHIELTLAGCDGTYDDFVRRLNTRGVTVLRHEATTKRVAGISFKVGEVKIKGSGIARAYSWKNLLKLLAERKEKYEIERNTQQNEATSTRSKPELTATSPTGPARPATARTGASGNQNRDVDIGVQSATASIPAPIAPVADANADYGHSGRPAHCAVPVSATSPECDHSAVAEPLRAAGPTPEHQPPTDLKPEPAGRGHQEDLRLAEEARSEAKCPIDDVPRSASWPARARAHR